MPVAAVIIYGVIALGVLGVVLVRWIRKARAAGKKKFADGPYRRAGKLLQEPPRNDLDDL